MRDALGGIVNIEMIVVFLVLINGYLAFSVNYTKAFRVKNKIITVMEQYEGRIESQAAQTAIKDYITQVGYTTDRNALDEAKKSLCGGESSCTSTCEYDLGFCYRKYSINDEVNSTSIRKTYYRIVTVINIDVPIINKIIPYMNFFRVTGDTKTILG